MPPPGTEKTQLKELTSQGERTVLSLLFPFFKFTYRVVCPSPSGRSPSVSDPVQGPPGVPERGQEGRSCAEARDLGWTCQS